MNPTQEEDHHERPPRDHWPWHFFNYLQQALAHPRRSSWASQLLLLLPKKNTSEPLLTPTPLLSLLNPLLTGSQAAAWQVRGQAATEEESGQGGERGRRRSSSFHSQLRIPPCHLQCATHPKYQRDQIQDFLRDKTFSTLPPPNPALSCISHILFAIAQRFPRPRFSNQFLIENIILRWKMFPLSYGFRSTQVHLTLHMIRVGWF